MTDDPDIEKGLAAAITDADFEMLELTMREPNIFRALAATPGFCQLSGAIP
jgi:hypothetical protein